MLMLQYVLMGLPYVVAALLALGLVVAGVMCHARFGAGLAVLVGIFSAECLYMILGGLDLGVSLYYTDLALGFMAVVTLLRLWRASDAPPLHWAWKVYGAVFLFNLFTGLATNGTAAGVQARPYFYAVVAATYPMTFRMTPERVRQLLDALAALAAMIVLLCVYRWIVYYTPIPALMPEEGTYNPDGAIRVVRSYEALVLAQVLTLALFFGKASRALRVARVGAPVLLGCVVVLQHRSVWVAAAAGLCLAFAVGQAGRATRQMQALLLGVSLVVVALPFALSDDLSGVSEQLSHSANSAATGEGTAGERLESWQAIVKTWATAGPRSLVIGQGAGYDPSRYVPDARGGFRKISYTAHNHYVQTLASMGLVGAGTWVVCLLFALRGLWRLSAAGGPDAVPAAVLWVLLVMQAVYYIPYSTDYLQHLILGMGVTLAARAPVPKRQPQRGQRWKASAPVPLNAAATAPARH